MQIDTGTRSRQKVIYVDGVDFTLDELRNPLESVLMYNSLPKCEFQPVLEKMCEAGLVEPTAKERRFKKEKTWQKTSKARELYNRLEETYSIYHVSSGHKQWGPFDSREMMDAKSHAEMKMDELKERNPDVEFRITEDEHTQLSIETVK